LNPAGLAGNEVCVSPSRLTPFEKKTIKFSHNIFKYYTIFSIATSFIINH